jgi:hypothetical protein
LSKQGAKGGELTVKRSKACVYWRLWHFDLFGRQPRKLVETDKSVVRDAQSHIFVILGPEYESEIPPLADSRLFISVGAQTVARNGSSHFQPAEQATE